MYRNSVRKQHEKEKRYEEVSKERSCSFDLYGNVYPVTTHDTSGRSTKNKWRGFSISGR